ncbi:MAG: hypothetical protein AAFY34_10550 [Pseudomonadota bacterium]
MFSRTDQPTAEELQKRIQDLSEQVEALRAEFIAKNRHLHNHNLNALRSARAYIDRGTQFLMQERFKEKAQKGEVLPFRDVEFSNYSQNGEDGVLHYIFSLVGATNRIVVELSAGHCEQCNATNLIINDNWRGILFEGNRDKLELGRKFFLRHFTRFEIPTLLGDWVTKNNINALIEEGGVSGEIDLFSLDVDGVDYWLLEALSVVSPRVIIAEAQYMWNADTARTVPYADDFVQKVVRDKDDIPFQYCGASIAAFVKLGKARGYRLVGAVGASGPNIILMRNDVGIEYFPEVSVSDILDKTPMAHKVHFEKCREIAKGLDWVDV